MDLLKLLGSVLGQHQATQAAQAQPVTTAAGTNDYSGRNGVQPNKSNGTTLVPSLLHALTQVYQPSFSNYSNAANGAPQWAEDDNSATPTHYNLTAPQQVDQQSNTPQFGNRGSFVVAAPAKSTGNALLQLLSRSKSA